MIDIATLSLEAAQERRRIIHAARSAAYDHGVVRSMIEVLRTGELAMTEQEWNAAADPHWVAESTVSTTPPPVMVSENPDEEDEDEDEDEECQHDDLYTCCGYCSDCGEHVSDDHRDSVCDQGFCHDCDHEC